MIKNRIKTDINENRKEVIIIFIIIPIIVLIASFLPLSMRDTLKVNLLDFNIITFYTAVFTHDSLEHFLGNIMVYYLYTFYAYLLSLISQRRKWFIRNYILFFLILPPIMYTALISANRHYLGNIMHFSCGLSGILSAVLGLLPMSFIAFLKNSGIEVRSIEVFYLIILTSALAIPYIYNDSYLLLAIVPAIVYLVWRNRNGLKAISRFLKKLIYQDLFSSTLVVSVLILYFTGIAAIFPRTIFQEGILTDILTHYIGWAAGLLISCFLMRYD